MPDSTRPKRRRGRPPKRPPKPPRRQPRARNKPKPKEQQYQLGNIIVSESEIQQLKDYAQADPVWWVRKVLGDDPWDKQCSILESVRDNKRTAVRSCHGAGKDWIAARAALWFLFCHNNSIVATTAPTFRQVRAILWQEIRKAHANSVVPLGGERLQTELRIKDGHFAFGFTADNPDAAQGIHADYVLAIIDEASGVPASMWTAIDGMLTTPRCRLLSIGNPTDPLSAFAKEFKPQSGAHKIHISAFDTPNVKQRRALVPGMVTHSWVEDKLRRWGESSPLYRSRVLGEFPDSSQDTLIPLPWIEAAQDRELEVAEPIELAVDVARFGSDETVIMKRMGYTVRVIHARNGHDTMETSGHVRKFMAETGAKLAKVDVVGLGAGVVDRLNELQTPVAEANAGAKSRDGDRFLNARAEWFWNLREMFEDGDIDIDPDDEELAAQLVGLRYKIDSRGRIYMESKDEMRRRGVRSPDRADALAIAFARLKRRGGVDKMDFALEETARESPWGI